MPFLPAYDHDISITEFHSSYCFLLNRYPLALKMKNQEDSKVKPDQLKKHGPLPFLEISLYWVLWILMCLYSMYSIFLASRGMTRQTTVHMYFNCPNKMVPVSTF